MRGRIIKIGNEITALGSPEFGVSKHIAKIILAALRFDSNIRSAMNIKYSKRALGVCKELKFEIGSFDRKNEPRKVSTMEWGTHEVIKNLGFVPDIIYDLGAIGKEPMIRILGTNPQDVIRKLRRIIVSANKGEKNLRVKGSRVNESRI